MSSNKTEVSYNTKGVLVPQHVAIIPDGNRRWARARGLPTLQGHKKGFDNAVTLARAARKMGIHTVTLWGFSTENWTRSATEVGYLMKLYERLVETNLTEAKKENVRIIHLGRRDRLPKSLMAKIEKAEKETKDNKKYVMNIALDYGGHDEILRGIRRIVEDKIPAEKIDKNLFETYLDTYGQPYPYVDLLIRTSGEQRTSGLLAWQNEYAEFYWEQEHFPSFDADRLWEAVLDYSRRRRRFGGNDEVKKFEFEPKLVANLEVNWWRLQNIPEGTRFKDYALQHLKEQFGLSKSLAVEATKYLAEALTQGNKGKWKLAISKMKRFYKLIREEFKLPFEPSLVANLEVKLWQDIKDKDDTKSLQEVEKVAQNLYAEVYRVSLLQAAKLAHLRIMAMLEKNLAQRGFGEKHWNYAEDYLEKFYAALRERVS